MAGASPKSGVKGRRGPSEKQSPSSCRALGILRVQRDVTTRTWRTTVLGVKAGLALANWLLGSGGRVLHSLY